MRHESRPTIADEKNHEGPPEFLSSQNTRLANRARAAEV